MYNENGLRVQKTVNGVITDYTLHGKNVVHMKRGNDELHFFYDAPNKPAIVLYNGVPYSYVKNLQGDIVALLDGTGAVVVQYTYDAWGKPISKTGTLASTLGAVQPFRYRGYVYDEETGLYYLRSRYYYPALSRFANADKVISYGILAQNTYCYCTNLPIVKTDHNGLWGLWDTEIKWNKPFKNDKDYMLTDTEFILYMQKMVDEKWQYDYDDDELGMRRGYVDCVSVYRYIIKHYYNSKGYYHYLPTINGNALDNVSELVARGVYDLQPIDDDQMNVIPGMALFCKDENGHYTHVAYAIGEGWAIEANVRTSKYPAGVHKIWIEDGNFTECAFLNGIYYSFWDLKE